MALNVLTAAQLAAINTAMVARFNKGLAVQKEDWKQIARLISSNGASNTYAFLSQFPAFREWVGARLHKTASKTAFQVLNRKFENTLDIPLTDIEDDNWGMYADIAESHGVSVNDLMNDLVFGKIPLGFSEVCYDGQFFFDTDHPVYPNEDGSGVATLVSNMQAGVGEPWVLLCTDRAPQPFYLQERTKAQFIPKTSAVNSDGVFENDMVSFGGRWRGEAVFGFWQLAFGSKADLTAANFEAAFKTMETQKGNGNRKLGITPDLLVCGPGNRSAAEALLKAQKNAAGADNINYNKVKLLVTPWLGA
ncbi:MAG: Mu-like prophage major head subunit gpT family protein [Gallionella sp.]|nr:Mu-like prophage major head subunit gpT family protein [Gallionella sp.]MDD4947437.1 Mu-like prophage major head subunit gpT family protein [Gallionella sp.]MDD5612442.1 Mu-like prophage major head subunit gpT family protein [Gallionella sp.]